MLELLFAQNALPNLHPAVVHFPLALLITAAMLDITCVVTRKWPWLDRAATALWVLGAAALGAAYLSGDQAASTMGRISPSAESVLADHENLAKLTLIAFSVVAVLRLLVSWIGRRDRQVRVGFFRLVALAAALAAQLLLIATADRGGALVYRHGLGVEAAGWSPHDVGTPES